MNLLTETILAVEGHGKSVSQIRWVGSADGMYHMSWDDFAVIAQDIVYLRFSGMTIVATDLVLVGDTWWLARVEQDGVQRWELREFPRKKGRGLTFKTIMASRGSPSSLHRLNPKWAKPDEFREVKA